MTVDFSFCFAVLRNGENRNYMKEEYMYKVDDHTDDELCSPMNVDVAATVF